VVQRGASGTLDYQEENTGCPLCKLKYAIAHKSVAPVFLVKSPELSLSRPVQKPREPFLQRQCAVFHFNPWHHLPQFYCQRISKHFHSPWAATQTRSANMTSLLGAGYDSSSEDEESSAPSKATSATTVAAAPDVSLEVWSRQALYSLNVILTSYRSDHRCK
jgi:hypothetical protein